MNPLRKSWPLLGSQIASPILVLIILSILALATPANLRAQENTDLPDIGSSAATQISPAEEAAYGRELLGAYRMQGYLLDDPLLQDYLDDLGFRLASHSDRPEQPFTFFIVRSRQINAFASLGGYVGINAGLVLTAEREDELAAVLAHEVSHSIQRHIVRSVESTQKDALPILLGMVAAIVASNQAGGSGDAAQAAVAGGIALMQQRQINFTRGNEHEADRIGIQLLDKAGMDPMAMADFFGRMLRATRSQGDATPDYLRTHPVTTTRISEAKDRARSLDKHSTSTLPVPTSSASPGISLRLDFTPQERADHSREAFPWARERLRVLSASNPAESLAEYQRRERLGETLSDPERYGLALARMATGDAPSALTELTALDDRHPHSTWLPLSIAEANYRAGNTEAALARCEALLAEQPRNRAVALSYARLLAESGTPEAGLSAQRVLRPLLDLAGGDAPFHEAFARASETAGDLVRAGEAWAEVAFLSGRAEDALNQLQRLKEREDLDYVQRARVEARITAITPTVLEMRARGIRPGEQGDQGRP